MVIIKTMINQYNMTIVSGPFTLHNNIDHSVVFYDNCGSLTFCNNGDITFENDYAGAITAFIDMIRANMNRGLKFLKIHDCLEIPLDDIEEIKLIYNKQPIPDSFYKLEKLISRVETLKAFW